MSDPAAIDVDERSDPSVALDDTVTDTVTPLVVLTGDADAGQCAGGSCQL